MALFSPIPTGDQFSSMSDLSDFILKRKALESEIPLQQAKANEANMMARLYATAFGLPVPQVNQPQPEKSILQKLMGMFPGGEQKSSVQPSLQQAVTQPAMTNQGVSEPTLQQFILSPEDQEKSSKMQPGESFVVGQPNPNASQMNRKQLVAAANQGTDFFQRNNNQAQPTGVQQTQTQMQPQTQSQSGLPMTPEAIRARQILAGLNKWKETPQEQEEREVKTDWRKGINKNTTEQLGEWGKTISASRAMLPILEHNQEIMANPAMQEVFSHPEYWGWDKAYLKKFSKNPDIIDGLNSLGTNVKSLYSIMGQEFKGAFRFYEKQMFDQATPNENDSFGQLMAKNNTLMAIRDLIVKRTTLAKQIVEGSNGTISPEAAEEIAEKQINAKDIRQGIKDNFKKMQEEALKREKELRGPKYTDKQLIQYYNDAIAAGVPKEAADKKLAELRGY